MYFRHCIHKYAYGTNVFTIHLRMIHIKDRYKETKEKKEKEICACRE